MGIHAGRGQLDGGLRRLVVSGEGEVGESGLGLGLGLGEAIAFAFQDEFGVVNQGHAVLLGEILGSGADEVDVRALVEDEARGLDWIAEAFDAGDPAGAERCAIHEQGVELDVAVAGEKAASAGVEGLVVFKDSDSGFYGLDGGGAVFEEGVADGERIGDAEPVGFDHVVGDGPGTAVDE